MKILLFLFAIPWVGSTDNDYAIDNYILQEGAFLAGYLNDSRQAFPTLKEAATACDRESACGGITHEQQSDYTLRKSSNIYGSPAGEMTWIKKSFASQLFKQNVQIGTDGPSSQTGSRVARATPRSLAKKNMQLKEAVNRLHTCHTHSLGGAQDGLAMLWSTAMVCVDREIQCKDETLAWIYSNLGIQSNRQQHMTCDLDAGISANVARASKEQMTRMLFESAAESAPHNYAHWVSLHDFHNQVGDVEAAHQAIITAASTAVKPADRFVSFSKLGMHFHNQKMWSPSYESFKAAHDISADEGSLIDAHSKIQTDVQAVFLGSYLCEWDFVTSLLSDVIPQLDRMREEHLAPPMHPWVSMCLPMPPPLRLAIARGFWMQQKQHAEQLLAGKYQVRTQAQAIDQWHSEHSNTKDNQLRRIRVGFSSADFKQKATAYLALSVFQHLDRSRLEVFLYASTTDAGGPPSEWRESLRQSADHLREVHDKDPVRASLMAQQDELDIMIDLDGYSNEGIRRGELIALRHAPVTVAWFVYMSTLGNDENDYIVADSVIAPPEVATHLSGRCLYLPTSFFPTSHSGLFPHAEPLFGIDKSLDTTRSKLGLPQRELMEDVSQSTFVFATFNKHLKIRPELFDAWCRVLVRLPNAVLWMLRYPKESEDRLKAWAEKFGVSGQLRFSDFVNTSEENFLRVWRGADAVLDTTIYGAHTGTVDALWAGLPVVTCMGHCVDRDTPSEYGDQMASRVAASMLGAIGLEKDLVATDLEDYTERCVRMATDHTWYDSMTQRIREARSTSDLWKPEVYGKRLSEGLESIWANFIDGKSPQDITVTS